MQRDVTRPTTITIQYDKRKQHILITDLSGEAPSIITKDDDVAIGETIRSLIENAQLPELHIAHLTATNSEVKGSEGLDFTDLNKLKDQGLGAVIGTVFGKLQQASNYKRS